MLRCTLLAMVATAAAWMSVGASELDVLPLGEKDLALQLGAAAPGTVVDTATGGQVDLEAMVARMAEADVILLGEEHTHLGQKIRQAEILRALEASTDRPLVLGMEFFQRGDREALARWGRGAIDDDTLLAEVGWYDRGSYRWGYYRPVMDVAREAGIPVVGLNVPREIPRAVNRGGLAGLTDTQREEIGEVTVPESGQHRYLIRRYFGDTAAMLPESWFENMYAAQCLWDVVMARSILAERPDNGIIVVVVGSGHVAYRLGIPQRLAAEAAAPLDVVIFCPVQAPAPDPEADQPTGHPMAHGHGPSGVSPAVFSRSLADYVQGFEAMVMETWPTLGLRLGTGEEGEVQVSMAWPDTPASEAGFAPGDRILDLDGEPVDSVAQLRARLARLEWGDRVDLRVVRGDEALDIAVLLAPEPVEATTQTQPGWTVTPVAAFEPSAESPVVVAGDDEITATMLTAPDDRRVVVVRSGDTVEELHRLGPDNRPVSSLYRTPRADGAVEIRRDGETITRLDRAGRPIG